MSSVLSESSLAELFSAEPKHEFYIEEEALKDNGVDFEKLAKEHKRKFEIIVERKVDHLGEFNIIADLVHFHPKGSI